MSRARILGVILAAAATAGAFVLTLQSNRAAPEGGSTALPHESAASNPGGAIAFAEIASASRPAERVNTVLEPGAKAALLLLDRVTRGPIANAKIRTGAGEDLGVTNAQGALNLSRDDVDFRSGVFLASLPWPLRLDDVPVDGARRVDGILVEATVPTIARIEIRIRPLEAAASAEVAVAQRSTAAAGQGPSPRPVEAEMAAKLRKLLERTAAEGTRASVSASALASAIEDGVGSFQSQDFQRQGYARSRADTEAKTMGLFVVNAPITGECIVHVRADDRVTWRKILRVERGETTSVEADLVSRPLVAGIVVDRDGSPFPNHPVKVFCLRPATAEDQFGPDPFWETAPFSAAGESFLSHQLTKDTDIAGRFAVQVPFTGEVRLFATSVSPERGSATGSIQRKLGSAVESAPDLRLVLTPPGRRAWVRLLAADGNPFQSGKVMFGPIVGSELGGGNPFVSAGIGADGWCDLSLAREKTTLVVTVGNSSFTLGSFPIQDGMEIRTGSK